MSQKKATRQRRIVQYCRLCYATGIEPTEEDVIPRWLREIISYQLRLVEGRSDSQAPPRVLLKVCEAHNNAMSRLFETPMKPLAYRLMDGEHMSLSPRNQDLIISWAVKTESLMDIAAREQFNLGLSPVYRGTYDRAESARRVLDLIAREGKPDNKWVVAAGFVDLLARERSPNPFGVPRLQELKHPWNTYVHAMGGLVLMTALGTTEQVQDFVDDCLLDDRLVILRPGSENACEWPPPTPLTQFDLIDLRKRSQHPHEDLFGWDRSASQKQRQAARSMKRTRIVGADALGMALTADYLRMATKHRVDLGLVDLDELGQD